MDVVKNLKLVDFDGSNTEQNFRCGNNYFSDNVWDFNGYVKSGHLSGSRLKLKFNFVENKTGMLLVVKWFMVHELLTGKFLTAKRSLDGVIRFVKFIEEAAPEIESFSEVTYDLLKSYFMYLLDAKSETTGEPLSGVAIKKCALAIKEILMKGNVKGWGVPEDVRYVQNLFDEMIIFNKSIKRDSKKAEEIVKEKIEDEDLIDCILKVAMEDLGNNENILAATSVVLSTQLGLRISELITIYSASIKQVGGDTMLIYSTGKLSPEPVEVSKPANQLVVYALDKIKEYAVPLQKESGLPYLFLSRNRSKKGYPVGLASHSNWNKNHLRPWIKQHNIRDKNNELIDFTSHTFRHAFASYALKGGASIEVISQLMNHKSIRGTTHYIHLFKKDVESRFSSVLHENAVIAGVKALEIKEKLKQHNPFKGKTIDQVNKIRRAMKIQVLSHGLCLHHPMRNEACAGDGVCLGCQNFLTTPEFLEVHKGRLEKVQNELSTASSNGPYEAKLKTIENYLLGIIRDLESQMDYRGNNDNSEYVSQDELGVRIV